jgi:uncharacterized protein YecE (DUF72 family)
LKKRNYCLVWSQQDKLITPPIVTTDFVYLRLIGDRSINERDFGKIQKDRIKEMQQWANILQDIQNNEKNVKNAIVAANNHYAGFGPMTTKLFAEMMKLNNHVRSFPIIDYKIPFIEFSETKDKQKFEINKQLRSETRQTDISEFFK